jgi:hypothetical protein
VRHEPKPRYRWTPLQRANGFKPAAEDLITHTMDAYGLDRDEAVAKIDEQSQDAIWVNDIYQVLVREMEDNAVQLNIRRRDGGPILRDWRHFQQIKNELLGPECEAVELYPAESRKVDTANKFHLWGIRDPNYRFPMGWKERDVSYDNGKNASPGMRQRPL